MSEPGWWSTPSNSDGAAPEPPRSFSAPQQSAINANSTFNSLPPSRQSRKRKGYIPFNVAVTMAVIAGAIGGVIGNAGGGSLFDSGAKFVSVNNSIERAPDSISALAAKVLPSVVSISTRNGTEGGTGTGFVIRSDGYLLTNNHVVAGVVGGGSLRVSFNDGKTVNGKIVGTDSAYDLAVIKVDLKNLSALQFGDSDKVKVGDSVIAIGSPLGLAGTVTSGIISAKDRAVTAGSRTSEGSFINALQTDAAINPGNSGGPLVDKSGAVIGINSAIATLDASSSQTGSIGLGFAIPINQARRTAEQLIKTGKSSHPVIGVSLDTRYSGGGARIAEVLAGSPAAKAGIVAGDTIVGIDGKSVDTADELIVAVRAKQPGDSVKLLLSANGSRRTVTVVLAASSD
ncbi:MAG: trypsin-like peptidase domain-containing protein [Actinobacteria bacterium]|nr:trypsin-like peptidase domain-containing protein [Actinomycetota bacterium]